MMVICLFLLQNEKEAQIIHLKDGENELPMF